MLCGSLKAALVVLILSGAVFVLSGAAYIGARAMREYAKVLVLKDDIRLGLKINGIQSGWCE